MLNKHHLKQLTKRLNTNIQLIAITLMAMLLPACGINLNPWDSQARINAQDQTDVNVKDVANQTNQLIGQTVTVRSKIVDRVGTSAVTISDKQLLRGENILVVNASPSPFDLPPNNVNLQVTGEVHKFNLAKTARDFNLNLPRDSFLKYENRPVIIARSLALAPKPGQVTQDPKLYYNRPVAVEAEIEKTISPIAFTLDEEQLMGASDLLVLNVTPEKAISQGQKVVVTGIVRPFVVADIQRDYNLTWDLEWQRQIEAEYSNKPVLIAQRVYPVDP
ncbi:MAG: hypothetical protein WBG73_14480 [Coleofasciculaceae cyanobacterium]